MATIMFEYFCQLYRHSFWKESAEKVCEDEEDIKGKVAIVTGSNTGIGKETVLQLAKRGATVIIAVRSLERGEKGRGEILERIGSGTCRGKIEVMKLDLSSFESIRKFVKDFKGKYDKLNILVNNAAIADPSGVLKVTEDGFEQHIGTNHLGPFLLTNLLLESLKKGAPSRVICVQATSLALVSPEVELLSKDEPKLKMGNGGSEQAFVSKLFNAIAMVKLAKELELEGTKGVKVFQMCPGSVRTESSGKSVENMPLVMRTVAKGMRGLTSVSPHKGCETAVYLAVAKCVIDGENAGSGQGEIYRFKQKWLRGTKILQDYAQDEERSKIVLEMSRKLVGLSPKQ